MTNIQHFTIRKIPAALAVMAAASIAMSVGAEPVLQFHQNSGFFGGGPFGLTGPPFTAAINPSSLNAGGLDFYNLITPPLGADATPQQAYLQMEWGCIVDQTPSSTTCANSGVATALGTGSGTSRAWGTPVGPFSALTNGRSSLEVLGLSGNGTTTGITGPGWTRITQVTHNNNPIDASSNKLDGVTVSSWLELGSTNFLESSYPTTVDVDFNETPNVLPCNAQPATGAPINPLNSTCDDFARLIGSDFTPIDIPADFFATGEPPVPVTLEFRPAADIDDDNALVCLGSNKKSDQVEDDRCKVGGVRYDGPDIIVYTAEGFSNTLYIEARLVVRTTPGSTPLFVIGDCEWDQWKPKTTAPGNENNLREVGDSVNFWGAQWWKNNCMSVFTSNGYPAFKGYATNVAVDADGSPNCGSWVAKPGNSGHPPATLPRFVSIIVTDNVVKNGPLISGNIKQIVTVDRYATVTGVPKDRYAGNPGHAGSGVITALECGPGAPLPPIVPEG